MIDGRIGDALATGRDVVRIVREVEVTFLAAAIAYYAFVSVVPALLLALAAATALGGDAVASAVLTATDAYLAPVGEETVGEAVANARGRGGATLVGVVALAWATLRVFRGLDLAFSRLYGTEGSVTLVTNLRNAAVVVLSIGAGIGAMLGVGAVLAVVALPGADLLGFGLLLVGLVVVFLPLYYVFPGVDLAIREALPGAALAAVGWVVLQALFQVYAGLASGFELYGVIGGVLLLVTWFYFAAVLVLLGAAVNVVVRGNRQGQGPPSRDIG